MTTCTETYRSVVKYGPPSVVNIIHCERTDVDDQGRHKGRHHGWEQMPAGERATRVPDPDRPGRTVAGTEQYDAWRRLWVWDRGGAQGSNARADDPMPCAMCGTLFYPSSRLPTEAVLYAGSPDAYSVADQDPTMACFHCRLWAERIESYPLGWEPTSPPSRGRMYGSQRRARLTRLRNADGSPSPRLNCWSEGSSGAFGNRIFTVRWDDGDQRGPASSLWDSGEIPWWLDHHFPPNAALVVPEQPTVRTPANPPIPYTMEF